MTTTKRETILQAILDAAATDVALQYHPNEVGFDPVKRADALRHRAERAEANEDWLYVQLEGYRALAALYGIDEGLNDLACYVSGLKSRIASLEGNAALPLENAPETTSTAVVKESLTTQSADMVNHPPHYQGKVECIDAIESALGPDGFAAYCRGNAIKYAFRAGRKCDARQDLAKAGWYLARVSA